MSPPLMGVEGEGPPINDSLQQQLKEHNYFGLSVDTCTPTSLCLSHHSKDTLNINLKATELRLGLPGSQSPPRDTVHDHLSLDEKPFFPLTPALSSGTKRPYSLTLHNSPSHPNSMFPSSKHTSQLNLPINGLLSKSLTSKDQPSSNTNAPAPKAHVVGWPPIRSFRKNTLSTTSKSSEPLFVKVSMDGAPYLRKVDLTTYTTYQQLSSALENLFSCFTLGHCGRENLSESKLKDLLNGSEYVVTYEDKDGDWMLVGDVPWEMFIDTCKRLKVMKSCDAIGLAPRAMEKSKNQN